MANPSNHISKFSSISTNYGQSAECGSAIRQNPDPDEKKMDLVQMASSLSFNRSVIPFSNNTSLQAPRRTSLIISITTTTQEIDDRVRRTVLPRFYQMSVQELRSLDNQLHQEIQRKKEEERIEMEALIKALTSKHPTPRILLLVWQNAIDILNTTSKQDEIEERFEKLYEAMNGKIPPDEIVKGLMNEYFKSQILSTDLYAVIVEFLKIDKTEQNASMIRLRSEFASRVLMEGGHLSQVDVSEGGKFFNIIKTGVVSFLNDASKGDGILNYPEARSKIIEAIRMGKMPISVRNYSDTPSFVGGI